MIHPMNTLKTLTLEILAVTMALTFSVAAKAVTDPLVGTKAPSFQLKNHDGKEFSLDSRKGKWTVLYFYPKAETPGCTKQACAFRDSLNKVQALKADVYGVSVNTVAEQAAFRKNHQLNFDLLADEEGKVASLYGAKMPLMPMAKRWTYILDPDLKIRSVDKDVDPVKDPDRVVEKLKQLQQAH